MPRSRAALRRASGGALACAAACTAACAVRAGAQAAPRAAAEPFTTYTRDDAARAAVEVDAGRPAPFAVPATLFGAFTENIWDAVYGGVWAQLLQNPSFEPDFFGVQQVLDAARYGRLVTDPSFGSGYVRVEPLVEPDSGRPGLGPARGRFVRSSAVGLPLPWEPLRADGARYEPRAGDAPNSGRALLVMGLPGREVGVRQGVYLPAHRTRRYTGTLWLQRVLRPDVGAGVLTVSLRRRDRPDAVLARAAVDAGAPGRWARHAFALELPAGALAPLEPVDVCLSVEGDVRVLVDNVLLWPADQVEGFDPEVLAAARAMRPATLRFGGNFVSGYHWRDGVGPLERRPTRLNQAWGLPEPNQFGTDEFLRLARLLGAEPQVAVNAGSGEAPEAAAWVEYVNGAASTPNGRLRAANGHPAPYGVRTWEVGNELWGDFQIGWQTAATNAARYLEFARAIRRVSPAAQLIATGGDVDFFGPWNGELLRRAGPALDLVSTHLVVGMQPGEQATRDAADAFTHRADFAVPVGVGRALDAMRAQVDADPRTRGRVRLAFNEWQFWSPRPEDPRFTNLGGAVNAAAFLSALVRRADFVPNANISNLVQFAGVHRQRGRVFVTPTADVFRLYRDGAGSRPLAVAVRTPMYDVRGGNRRVPDVPDVPLVDALALRSAAGDTLRLYLVNRDLAAPLPAAVALRGFAAAPDGRVHQLAGASLAAANSPEAPAAVRAVTSALAAGALAADGTALRLVLPPHSVTVVELRRR